MTATPPLVLASTSPYRRELLGRLQLEFATCSPDVDERRLPEEDPHRLVQRLAEAKARAGADQRGAGLYIGSDQVAVVGEEILGKPGNFANACAQLARLSGRQVRFLTGLCLYNSVTGGLQRDVVPYTVVFRELSAAQIEDYVRREEPFNCAGSFKSEGLGVALFAAQEGTDPTALVGLPLIRLVSMLAAEGVPVLGRGQRERR